MNDSSSSWRPGRIISLVLILLFAAVTLFRLWETRNHQFPSVWLCRVIILALLTGYASIMLSFILYPDSLMIDAPAFLSWSYLKTRSTLAMTALLTAAAFAYYAWARRAVGPQPLLVVLLSEISTNAMFCVLILLVDAFILYYYRPKMAQSSLPFTGQPQHATMYEVNRSTSPKPVAQTQMDYFSPKSKSPPNAAAGNKHPPFDTGKFSYAR